MKWSDKLVWTTLTYAKLTSLALLLVLSWVNGHSEYICKHPSRFVSDTVLVATGVAASFAAVALMRGHSAMILEIAFMSFFLFFAFNVLRELAGLNSKEQKQSPVLRPLLVVTAVALAVWVAVLAVKVAAPLRPGSLAIEAMVMGAFMATSEAYIAFNHGESAGTIARTFAMYFAGSAIGHVALQRAGFYRHVFTGRRPSAS